MRELYLSGFADEAAYDLEGQINAIKALGWKYLEARKINGRNIHDLNEPAFDKLCAVFEETGIKISCFCSNICNWGTPVDSDLEATMTVVKRAIKRMQRLKVPLISIMSYAVIYDEKRRPKPDQKEAKRFEHLRKICDAFLEAGLTPVQDGYFSYGGLSWEHTLKLLDNVPGLKLVFDTSEPNLSLDYNKTFPYPSQNYMEIWNNLKEHVVHIRIKDCSRDPITGRETCFYPGEGDHKLKAILTDALSIGYSGFFAIEPHMVDDDTAKNNPGFRNKNFFEYGKLTEDLFRNISCDVKDGTIYPKENSGLKASKSGFRIFRRN